MKRMIIASLALLLASGWGAHAQQADGDSLHLRMVQYNMGAFHKSGKSTPRYVARMMKEADADIISINEIDSCNIRSLGRDQLRIFRRAMGGWAGHFGNALSFGGGGYGVALCWNPGLRAANMYTLNLERGGGAETRAAAIVEFDRLVVASTHLDYLDRETNLSQAMTLSEHLKDISQRTGKPVLLCGDLNALPDGGSIAFLMQDWELLTPTDPTFPSWNPAKCIDYIFLHDPRGTCRRTGAGIPGGLSPARLSKASDHLPVAADIAVAPIPEIGLSDSVQIE